MGFTSGSGKYHLNDTWTIHTKYPKLEIDEKRKL